MTLSLNEVEATAKKATRGAGYSWGLAEEAGKATRWLCARDLNGCKALAELLVQTDGSNKEAWTPHCDQPVWRASGGRLCPLIAGAALSDRALALSSVRLVMLVAPLLLLPFVALAAQQRETVLQIEMAGASAATDGTALSITGVFPSVVDELAVVDGGSVLQPVPVRSRADPDAQTLQFLNTLAHRTYAPATDASRMSGAGAGLSDND